MASLNTLRIDQRHSENKAINRLEYKNISYFVSYQKVNADKSLDKRQILEICSLDYSVNSNTRN
jgi:hypothetical protein